MLNRHQFHKMGFWLKRDLKNNNYEAVKKYIEKYKDDLKQLDVANEEGLSLFAWCFGNGHYYLATRMLYHYCYVDSEYLNQFPEQAAAYIDGLLKSPLNNLDNRIALERLFKSPTFNVNIAHKGIPLLLLVVQSEYPVLRHILENPSVDFTARSPTDTVLTEVVSTGNQTQIEMLLADPRILPLVNVVNNQNDLRTPVCKLMRRMPLLHQQVSNFLNELLKLPGVDVLAQDVSGDSGLSLTANHIKTLNWENYFIKMLNFIGPERAADKHFIDAIYKANSVCLSPNIVKALIGRRLHTHVDLLLPCLANPRMTDLVDLLLNDPYFNPYLEIANGENYVTYAIKHDRALYHRLRKLAAFQRDAFFQHQRSFIAALVAGCDDIALDLQKNFDIDVNCLDHQGNGALHKLAEQGDFKGIMRFMELPGANLNLSNAQGDTFLHVLIRNRVDINEYLELPGIEVNVANKNLETPLNLAIKLGNEQATVCLLRKYFQGLIFDVNFPDIDGNSPLANLLSNPWKDAVDLIFNIKELMVSMINHQGRSILMIASQLGLADIVQAILVRDNRTINHQAPNGDTALSLLAQHQDNVAIARMLIQHGARMDVPNCENIAVHYGHQCIATFFRAKPELVPPQWGDAAALDAAPSAPPPPPGLYK